VGVISDVAAAIIEEATSQLEHAELFRFRGFDLGMPHPVSKEAVFGARAAIALLGGQRERLGELELDLVTWCQRGHDAVAAPRECLGILVGQHIGLGREAMLECIQAHTLFASGGCRAPAARTISAIACDLI
jgi:hypothetical protein